VADPVTKVKKLAETDGQIGLPHPKIPLPHNLYGKDRANSAGLDLANEHRLASLSSALLSSATEEQYSEPRLGGNYHHQGELPAAKPVINPATPSDIVGYVRE
ncbi:hypothetical protein LWT93_22615, partial [Enterobacter hormaechei]|nr:hypothetical protein [Enterobacter hormaechei]